MSPPPRRRGAGRSQKDRQTYQRQIAESQATPTAPETTEPFSLEAADSTAAPAGRGARVQLRPAGEGAARPRPPRRRRRSWMTFWTAFAAITTAVAVLGGGIWTFVSLRSDIAVNAAGLKSAEDKHNTFAARVGEDLKRLEAYVEKRFNELLNQRRDSEPRRRR